MDRPAGPALRWARAGVVAAVATGSGVVAHVSADGRLPGAVALAVLFLVCWAGAARFLARPASRLRLVLLVVAGQTLAHGVLTAMVGHRGDPPLVRATAAAMPLPPVIAPPAPAVALPATPGHRVGSLADLTQAGRPPAGPTELVLPAPVQHLLADLTGPHALMALAHLVAAVGLGWWLARGERLLWDVLLVTAAALADLGRTARAGAHALASLAAGGVQTLRRTVRPAPGSRWPDAVAAQRRRILAVASAHRGPPLPCG
jgi:hypothetical protein